MRRIIRWPTPIESIRRRLWSASLFERMPPRDPRRATMYQPHPLQVGGQPDHRAGGRRLPRRRAAGAVVMTFIAWVINGNLHRWPRRPCT